MDREKIYYPQMYEDAFQFQFFLLTPGNQHRNAILTFFNTGRIRGHHHPSGKVRRGNVRGRGINARGGFHLRVRADPRRVDGVDERRQRRERNYPRETRGTHGELLQILRA